MDEQQIQERELTDAYGRLGTSLAPPPDVVVRVERQIGVRRRRRRTAAGAAAALVVAGAVGGAVVLGSGSGDRNDVAIDPGDANRGSFTLVRQDGSQVELRDFTLSCNENPMGGQAWPGRIYLWTPPQFTPDASAEHLTGPYAYFEAVADRADGKTYTLPVSESADDNGLPEMVVFAAEADGDGHNGGNEVSSAESSAAGTVKVLRATCDPEPVLEIEVDATLGSEVGQGSERLVGSYP